MEKSINQLPPELRLEKSALLYAARLGTLRRNHPVLLELQNTPGRKKTLLENTVNALATHIDEEEIERKEYLLRPWDNSPFNQTLVTVESENTQIRKSKKEINKTIQTYAEKKWYDLIAT